MSDDKNLTPEQQIDALVTKCKSLEETIEKMNEPQYKGVRASVDSDTGAGVASYWAGETGETATIVVDRETGMPIPRQFADYKRKGYAPGYLKASDARGSEFKSFGEFLKTGMEQGKNPDFRTRHVKSFEPAFKSVQGLNVSVGEDGGYMVYPEYASGILERMYTNNIFSRTDNYSVVGNTLTFNRDSETSRANGSRHGGVRGYWVEEGGTITKSQPSFKRVTLRLKKLAAVVYLTDELIADGGPVLEQYVSRKVAEEFNFLIGDSVFNGDGIGKPLGIMNSGSLIAVAKESGQAAATVVSENIDKMASRRFVGYNDYAWYHNQDVVPALDQLAQDVGTGGLPLYRQDQMITKMAPQSLKGFERVETEFNETLGQQGDLVLADLSQVLSISKGGISQEASIHVEFFTDQTALRFIMRLDARPWEDSPITPYKTSNTQSAFVTLAART